MTLSTNIYLTGNVDAREVFDFCNKLIGAENPSFTDTESEWVPGMWVLMNQPGQGYPAWLSVSYRKDGPLATEDIWVTEEDGYRFLDQKACSVEINFDTGYSYQDEFGGCSDLHGRYITMINLWAEERGATLSWKNEFSGEYFDGTDGLKDFGGEGAKAAGWVKDVFRALLSEDN